jgi:cell division protein FtsZ
MTLNLTLPVTQHTDFSPRIAVIGVGGGGTNAVNNMISLGLDGVDFIVANTDAQSLMNSKAERRVQLGPHLTQGLGAGAKPEIGRAAAEEAIEELARHLEGCHMVFVTAGMGGGTGTGAAPVIARMARERGILTVGVVTKPFDFEGPKRRRAAEYGLDELQQFVDTLIVVPNQNLFRLANERTTFQEAFRMADNVLYMGVRGVTDLMVAPGLVNLDFADVRTVMAEMGKAMMGTGEAEGEDRAVKAAEAAISNPLLEDTSVRGARGVLINITGGLDMTLFEVDEAATRIRREVDEDANIMFGSSIDETMNGRVRVSVVATGIDVVTEAAQAPGPRLAAVDGAPTPTTLRATPAPVQAAAPAPARRPVAANGAGLLRQAAAPAMVPAVTPDARIEEAMPAPQAVVAEAGGPPPYQPPLPEPPPASGSGWRNIFRTATGLMHRQPPGEAAAPPPARRAEPAPAAAPSQRTPREPTADERLDIPTFLRRQSN